MPTRRSALAAAGALSFALSGIARASGKPLRYLQIGTGHAHASKLSVYAESGEWEIVGIVEEDAELRTAAERHSLYGNFPFLTLEEGLKIPNLRVVGVETRVRDLLHYARLAVDAGCHVHLDKPAGASLPEYRELMKQADEKGLVVQMGYMYRFNPAVQLLHRMLAAGWLGEVFETHAVMSKLMPPKDRQQLSEFAGGTMFELGCHIIDLTLGVLGQPDRVVPFPRRTVETPDDTLVDNMLAVLEYPKATATVRTTGLEVDGFARRHFTVCGTEGTFHIQPLDRPSVTLSLSQERSFGDGGKVYPKGTSTIAFEPPYQRYVGDAADLAAIVRGEKKNPYPSAHDLTVQETVLAAAGMSLDPSKP
ncbi:MAG TPA: Gfo/Idh/MocA family oxidoreductase [Bacteroidia bacterium]|nr:Gfo/Idh/MocA family oxidoreductase [Bacteroidia bacterium]